VQNVEMLGETALDAARTATDGNDPGDIARCAAELSDAVIDCTTGEAEPAASDAGSLLCSIGADAEVPLPRLLAEAEALFALEFDRLVRGSEFPNLSLAHARNVLRHLGEEPRRASAIVADCGVSKQALSQQIALLAHDGLLTVHADPCDARARLLTLTPKGVDAQHLVHRLFRQIEDDWAADLGVDGLAAFRRALLTLLARRPVTGC